MSHLMSLPMTHLMTHIRDSESLWTVINLDSRIDLVWQKIIERGIFFTWPIRPLQLVFEKFNLPVLLPNK